MPMIQGMEEKEEIQEDTVNWERDSSNIGEDMYSNCNYNYKK